MKALNKILLLCIFFLIIFSITASATIGNMEAVESGWHVSYSTDEGYFIYFDDSKQKQTQICLLSETATNQGQLPTIKQIYQDEGIKIGELHPQMKRIDETNYFGYCYQNDNFDYLKFGEHSTVVTYQDENLLVYDCGDDKSLNVTLYKNVSDVWETSGDIFVYNYEGECKFGANDSANTDVEVYKYELIFTLPYVIEEEDNFIHVIDEINRLRHHIDFNDICSGSTIGCEFIEVNDRQVEIIFDSDKNIDPIITVETIPSYDMSLTALDEYNFIFARSNGNITLYNFNTDGTLNYKKVVNQTTGANARLNVKTIDASNFLLTFYSELDTYNHAQRFNSQLINQSQLYTLDKAGLVTDYVAIDTFILGDNFFMGVNGNFNNNVNLTRYNLTNPTINKRSIQLDPLSSINNVLLDEISCSVINSTLVGCFYYIDNSNEIDYAFVDVSTTPFTIYRTATLDSTTGEQAQIGIAVINESSIGYVFQGTNDNDVYYGVLNANGTVIYPQTSYDVNAGSDGDVEIAVVFDVEVARYRYVAGYYDSNAGNINAFVFEYNGTFIRNFTLAEDESPTQFQVALLGENTYTDVGVEEGTFVVAYTNASDYTIIKTFFINGTLWSGISFEDNETPVYSIISPVNNTYTTNESVNFSINVSDDEGLKNATLYIYNESGDLIAVEEGNLTGTQSIFSKVYTFVLEGVYNWFVNIYDLAGNFVDTVMNTIIVDISSPEMAYVSPTFPNGTITPFDFIEVNVTAIDVNLSYIEINFYEGTTLNATLNSSTSPLYSKFENLKDLTTYRFNATSCDTHGLCTDLATREIMTNSSISSSLEFTFIFEQYPYLDVNVSYLFEGDLTLAGLPLDGANVTLFISKGSQNWTYPMNFSSSTGTYIQTLEFTEEGTYNFIATADHSTYGTRTASGTFYVKDPFYVTFRLYELKDTEADPYENDFAYLIAYPQTSQLYYDDTMEQFVTPLLFKSSFNEDVFHAEYKDGEATIKLWDKGQKYNVRLIDGQISFDNVYSPPKIAKSYKVNMYVGNYTLTGNQTYNVYIDDKDLKPYFFLFNIILLIIVIVCVVTSIIIFFVIPDQPAISIAFGLVFPIILIILRILIYIWKGM